MSEIGDFRKNNISAEAKIRHWPRHSKRDSGVGVFPGKPGFAVSVGRRRVPQWLQRPDPDGDELKDRWPRFQSPRHSWTPLSRFLWRPRLRPAKVELRR